MKKTIAVAVVVILAFIIAGEAFLFFTPFDPVKIINNRLIKRFSKTFPRVSAAKITYYDTALKIDPADTFMWQLKAAAFFKAGKKQQAIDSLDEALKTDPKNAGIWAKKGRIFFSMGLYDQALINLDKALAIKPKSPDMLYEKAECLQKLGKRADALAQIENAIKLKPGDDSYKKMKEKLAEKTINTAELIAKDVVIKKEAVEVKKEKETMTLKPVAVRQATAEVKMKGQAHPFFNSRKILQSKKIIKTVKAVAFKEIIPVVHEVPRAQPKKTPRQEAYELRAKAGQMFLAGRFEQAIEIYDKALRLFPSDADTWYSEGLALLRLGRVQEAVACFDEAIKITPQNFKAWGSRGNAMLALGKNDEALRSYDSAIRINPRDARAWNNKGSVLFMADKKKALECYGRAVNINPLYADAWFNKANALYELKRFNEALSCVNEAEKLGSSANESLRLRQMILKEIGKL